MHARTVLQKVLHSVTPQFDRRNVRTLFLAVEALHAGRRLTLMELARHWPGALHVHAPLKRLDRFLSNGDVQAQRSDCYAAASAWLIRNPTSRADRGLERTQIRWTLACTARRRSGSGPDAHHL